MGCSHGKSAGMGFDNFFKVYNLDEDGAMTHKGRFEVTRDELILYQKHREKMHWPLRCLRRYGYQNNMFSFECGRRSPTGAGIYAFRCEQSEKLFTLVQSAINSEGLMRNGDFIPNVSPIDCVENGIHTYINMNMNNANRSRINGDSISYALLSDQNIPAVLTEPPSDDNVNSGGQYVNVSSIAARRSASRLSPSYTNLNGNTLQEPVPTSLQYIELDLTQTTPDTIPSTPASPKSTNSTVDSPRRTEGYALIDFDRTAALSNSNKTTRQMSSNAILSSIDESFINTLTRNDSQISEKNKRNSCTSSN